MPSWALAKEGANGKLNLALMGCGGRMGQILGSSLQQGDQVVAICDVDTRQIANLKRAFGAKVEGAKVYEDYRKLLDSEKGVDAVLIAAGQHWRVGLLRPARTRCSDTQVGGLSGRL